MGGNVLVPCYSSGVIYDLFECLSVHLEQSGHSTVPMYFVSPIAEHSLVYSNILAEWLTLNKQSRVYIPEGIQLTICYSFLINNIFINRAISTCVTRSRRTSQTFSWN
jgi:integrator complex subunit 9